MNLKPLKATSSQIKLYLGPPSLKHNKSSIWVERSNFYCAPVLGNTKGNSGSKSEYLIVGFDTEFKTSEAPIRHSDLGLEDTQIKNLILSYQFSAKLGDFAWEGICCPKDGERITLGEFMVFVLGEGRKNNPKLVYPKKIYLVGHFTRADIPAFADFVELTGFMTNVRSTFLSTDTPISVSIDFEDQEDNVDLNVFIRDTMLLTPAASKSLKALGELVGIPKLMLSENSEKQKFMIRNMDLVREKDWELFKRYAINDAHICLKYIEMLIERYKSLTGKNGIPVTLTSIGVELLMADWRDRYKDDQYVQGREIVKEKYWKKKQGGYNNFKKSVLIEEVYRHREFVTECYHGGRNEQFWFGPSYEGNWTDFDLVSAYPTAMALIGKPRWKEIRQCSDVDEMTPITLGFASVKFKFPNNIRYPTIPVRTDNGLIFPLEGVSCCAAPEIYLAKQLGAEIEIRYGLIVPCDPEELIFGEFIKYCISERNKAGKKTLNGLFWKELSNSTYGKTAQGLREKRVYDMRDRSIKALPKSKITNPYFAAYITSFVRAVLGEVINAVPSKRMVFSCTTDGFLTDATEGELQRVQRNGSLTQLYAKSQEYLTGASSVLERKHGVKQLLGWRTRGQATLVAGEPKAGEHDYNIVLAKGGIYTRPELEGDEEQNEEIVKYFFNRSPTTSLDIPSKLGVRDMVEMNADLVEKILEKRLSMEFDWKRCSESVGTSKKYSHVFFSTKPWQSIDQFISVKELWGEFVKGEFFCIKTEKDFSLFADLVQSKFGVDRGVAKYLHKKDPDVQRLRQQFCSAWRLSAAGLTYDPRAFSAPNLANELTYLGIPTQKHHIQNGHKKAFIPYSSPGTLKVKALLKQLKIKFPELQIEMFIPSEKEFSGITLSSAKKSSFARLVE